MEIKWRIENINFTDGLSYFQFIYIYHTHEHILNLLNYIKQKNYI